MVDASWAIASRGDGRFDRELLLGATLPQFVAWVVGTVIGVLGGSALGDLDRLGLDAVFPAFFLVLLAAELRSGRRALAAALLAAGLALALVPVSPPGVALASAAIKAAGPILVGGRELSPAVASVIALLAPALLTALVVVETFSEGQRLVLDAKTIGVAVAAVALVLRAPMLVVVTLAAAITAAARALG